MERVFADANVLYPISIADLVLRLGDIALHAVAWSEDLLAEVDRVLVGDKGLTPALSRAVDLTHGTTDSPTDELRLTQQARFGST